jgi:hypothetical protein
MSDHELLRLLVIENDALARYNRIRRTLYCSPDVVERARIIWADAADALLNYQDDGRVLSRDRKPQAA